MGAQRIATKIDQRRSEMESPIEVVRRFCAAWSDNIGSAELAAFFADDAVYHNIPMAPVTGRAWRDYFDLNQFTSRMG
jgi:limonene-1,2-epoxide hydrolase